MRNPQIFLGLFFSASMSISAFAENGQCVTINIPAFNLAIDSNCTVSNVEFVQSSLPDQVFLHELGIPSTCFVVVDPQTEETEVDGEITYPITGRTVAVTVSGVAGLTLNPYPKSDPGEPLSFTAATLLSIDKDGKHLGLIVTRDAGTLFADGNVAAQLSVSNGTKKFKNAIGSVYESGQEFDPFEPAWATGTLCSE